MSDVRSAKEIHEQIQTLLTRIDTIKISILKLGEKKTNIEITQDCAIECLRKEQKRLETEFELVSITTYALN